MRLRDARLGLEPSDEPVERSGVAYDGVDEVVVRPRDVRRVVVLAGLLAVA